LFGREQPGRIHEQQTVRRQVSIARRRGWGKFQPIRIRHDIRRWRDPAREPHGRHRAMKEDYEILSVEPAEAPYGLDGSGWHRYVIVQGDNKISGYRQGSLNSIRQSVEEIVMRLNERRVGKRGRVHIDMSTRSKSALSE
jgi:hypothetical protein